MADTTTTTETRKRDAQATAERIRQCAQAVFHEKGYDAATTRDIADRAGVNIALIKRYYGSKLGLFKAAVLPYLSIERFFTLPTDRLADAMADNYVHTEPMPDFDAFVVLLRSVSSPEAGPLMVEALEEQALIPLTRLLDGPDASARAILIATQLAGLILLFRIFQRTPKSEAEREAIRVRLRAYLQDLIEPD